MTAEDVVRRSLQTWNADDRAGHRATYADGAVVKEHATGREIVGGDAIAEAHFAWRAAFPGIRGDIENLVAAGDQVVYETTWKGTHSGPLTTGRADDSADRQGRHAARLSGGDRAWGPDRRATPLLRHGHDAHPAGDRAGRGRLLGDGGLSPQHGSAGRGPRRQRSGAGVGGPGTGANAAEAGGSARRGRRPPPDGRG